MSEPRVGSPRSYPGKGYIPKPQRTVERIIGLLIAAIAFLNFPILSVFSEMALVFGVPVLYFYLFLIWGLIIGAMALILHYRPRNPSASADPGESADN